MVTAAAVRAALFAMLAVAATISPPACIAPVTTSVPRAIASATGFVIAAPRVACSVRVLCAPLRFDALFVVLRLRDTFARFEAVFVARDALFVVLRLRDAFARFEAVFLARDAVFAAVRPRALLPPALARDLDAVVFAGVLLRVDAVLDAAFFETADFIFIGAAVFFAAGRPRPLIPPPDLEAVVFEERREFTCTIGAFALGPAILVARTAQGKPRAKTYRIVVAHPSEAVTNMSETGTNPNYRATFEELRRLGYVEGQNLVVERRSFCDPRSSS